MNIQAVILAGGLGTRLKNISKDLPKVMVDINGKPFLEWVIRSYINSGITEIILATGYKSNYIKQYFKDGSSLGARIQYSEESKKLGTGGAIKNTEKLISENYFIVQNGDTYVDLNYFYFLSKAKLKNNYVFIAITREVNAKRFGSVILDEDGETVKKFSEKKNTGGYINSGIYFLNNRIFNFIEPDKEISFEYDVLPNLCKKEYVSAMNFNGFMVDMGTPDSYLDTISKYSGLSFFNLAGIPHA